MKRTELTAKDINYIIELYHQKKSMREIGAIIHIAPERVKKILLENKIVINKKGIISTFDLHKQEIIQKYKNGYSLCKLSKEYSITKQTLHEKLVLNGITIRTKEEAHVSKMVDNNFFSSIDTPEKAYILGFAFADGSISPNREKQTTYCFSLSIMESDKYLLENIKKIMNCTHAIQVTNNNNRYSTNNQCHLGITSKQIYQDLLKLGMDTKEHIPNMSQNLIPHFIRGYFDGDGCVSVSKRNDIEIKILGTESFLNELNQYINFSCVRYKKGIYEIRKGGVNNALRFYKYIYQDATIYLKRKFYKFYCRLGPKLTEDPR